MLPILLIFTTTIPVMSLIKLKKNKFKKWKTKKTTEQLSVYTNFVYKSLC